MHGLTSIHDANADAMLIPFYKRFVLVPYAIVIPAET